MSFRTGRRYSRRRGKLTKARIYLNRGAKAQSKQRAALNRKVNWLAKVNKPELRVIYRNWSHTFTNSTLASNYANYHVKVL